MKKTLIALALVSLPVAASAEVVLYGSIKGGVEYNKTARGVGASARNNVAVTDLGSVVGIKGSEDLGGGLKAIWQLESDASIGSGSFGAGGRDSFIGFEGGFGRVTAGNVSTPLKGVAGGQDNWEYKQETNGLDRYTRYGTRRVSVNYYTPDMNGFNAHFQAALGGNVSTDVAALNPAKDPDKFPVLGLGLNYKNAGFFGAYGVEYRVRPGKDPHIHNLTAGYEADNLYVAAGVQYAKNVGFGFGEPSKAEGTARTWEAQISAAYTAGNVTPKLTVAHGRSKDGAASTRYTQAIVGADYAFSRRTTGLVSLGWLRDKGQSANWGLTTGVVHKF